MAQYIDKSALIAEIERLKADALQKRGQCKRSGLERIMHQIGAYNKILSLIDTLEAKEVDLDESARHYLLHEHVSPLNEVLHQADLKVEMQYHKDIVNAYKAGFELGLKTQKGENVII